MQLGQLKAGLAWRRDSRQQKNQGYVDLQWYKGSCLATRTHFDPVPVVPRFFTVTLLMRAVFCRGEERTRGYMEKKRVY